MARYPLLVLRKPENVSAHRKNGIHVEQPRRPSAAEQGVRLGPKFETLQATFNSDRLTIQDSPEGLEPEKAIVLEVEGAIEDFQNAVKRIEGLEWLADWTGEDLEPGEGFYFESETGEPEGKPLRARLYVTMTNQRGAQELVSLWNRFLDAEGSPQFAYGLGKFRNLFWQLHDLRLWGVLDRLEETGLREDWEERIREGEETVRSEIELWYREDPDRREQAERRVSSLVDDAGGRVISQCGIEEIAYHALLVELPIETVTSFFRDEDVALVRCDEVMYIRPRGQISATPVDDSSELPEVEDSPPEGGAAAREPRVGLLDGLPIENHVLLENRLLVDDPEDWAADYPVEDRKHGTAMASLIVHGDLGEGSPALYRPVYVRPIMRPRDALNGTFEEIPGDLLTLDRFHRAVRRIFEGDGEEPAAAPTLVLINLSLGDATRPFLRAMSPWARLLDFLSYKYRVLFLVSSGNYSSLRWERALDLESMRPLEREKMILQAVQAEARHRRLLSPGETINSLTVGALHGDAWDGQAPAGYAFDPMPSGELLPGYFSALGLGFRRSVKPDLFLPGGRQYVQRHYGAEFSGIDAMSQVRPPGQRVAYPPQNVQGGLGRTAFTRGTSNSTALTSRAGALILEALEDSEQLGSLERHELAVVVKALLVHGCSKERLVASLLSRLEESEKRRETSRFLGYGSLDLSRALYCLDGRVTLWKVGEFSKDDEGHRYKLPLPPSLASKRIWRRLTITLAWLTPIHSTHQKYRRAALWFQPFGEQEFETQIDSAGKERRVVVSSVEQFDAEKRLALSRRQVDFRQVRNGTVQHEILEGKNAVAFVDGEEVHIQVNCRTDAGKKRLDEPIPYALAVTLEVREGVTFSLYEEIRDRLRVSPIPPR